MACKDKLEGADTQYMNLFEAVDFQSQKNSVGEITPFGFKKTDVGIIPEDWDEVEFGRCFSIISGLGFNKSEYSRSGIRLIRIDNVSYGKIEWDSAAYLPECYLSKYPRLALKQNDLLLALNRPITNGALKFAIVENYDLPSILYQRVGKIEKISEDLNQTFSFYILSKFIKRFVEESSVGSDQPFISTTKLKKLLLPLPSSVHEQTAIANALSDVDALINSLEKLIAKKQAIKTATMQQLLTGKTRLPQFATHPDGTPKGYKQTELGEIPEDWEISNIEAISLVPMQNGLFYEPSRKGVGIKLVNVGDMYSSAPILVDSLELFDATEPEKKHFKVEGGDIFFTRSSVVPSGIAFCNIFPTREFVNAVFDSHLIRVRVNPKKADAKYVYLNCLESHARYHLIASAKTATMTTIDQGAIKSCPVILPPLEEQTEIAMMAEDLDQEINRLKKKYAKNRQIKQGMMQELLTGKTRLVGVTRSTIE